MNLSHLATLAGFSFLGAAVNQTALDPQHTEVLMNSTLRMLSFAGAIGGGFMALAFFPIQRPQDATPAGNLRADSVRWVACSLFGGCFGPAAVEYVLPKYGFPLTTSTTLATSAFLGMFAWLLVSAIHLLIKKRFLS